MKITFFVSSLSGGGAEKMMLSLASAALNEGHSVDLLLVRKEGAYLKKIPDGINLIVLKKAPRISGLLKIFVSANKPFRFSSLLRRQPRFLTIVNSTCAYFNKNRPDLVISTLHTCNLTNIMARECVAIKPMVIVRECIHLSSFIKSVPSRKLTLLPYIKLLYPLADKVVSVSKSVENDLITKITLCKSKSRTIYNPVIADDFYVKSQEPVQNKWLNDKNTFVILGAGRLTKQKDFSTLIRAFAIARKIKHMKLLILGEGNDRDTLQNLISSLNLDNDISLHGFVDNPLSYMNKADLFILSSLLEGAPNVLVEAMACGNCQIISTNSAGGSSELLNDGKFGALVPPEDTKLLAKIILNIYNKNQVFQSGKDFAKTFTPTRSLHSYINCVFPND